MIWGFPTHLLDPLRHVLLVNVVRLVPVWDKHHFEVRESHLSPALQLKKCNINLRVLCMLKKKCKWHSLEAKLLECHHGSL